MARSLSFSRPIPEASYSISNDETKDTSAIELISTTASSTDLTVIFLESRGG